MLDITRPYLEIREGRTEENKVYDRCFLVWKERCLEVTPTDYALLQTLLGEGLNVEDASEERQALKTKHGIKAVISDKAAEFALYKLRNKVTAFFPDLVIPKRARLGKIKLHTTEEISDIQKQISNPEPNSTYIIYDENDRAHLIVSGVEIHPGISGCISAQLLTLISIFIGGPMSSPPVPVAFNSRLFKQAWMIFAGTIFLQKKFTPPYCIN